jgi:hypothetical protein
MVVGFTTIQSVPITTEVVSLNPVHSEVYSIQHYVIQACQWLTTGWWFSPGTPVSSMKKIDHHDITEILLKVALITITLTLKVRLVIHRNLLYLWCTKKLHNNKTLWCELYIGFIWKKTKEIILTKIIIVWEFLAAND